MQPISNGTTMVNTCRGCGDWREADELGPDQLCNECYSKAQEHDMDFGKEA